MTKTNHYLTALAVLVTLVAMTAVTMAATAGNAGAATKAGTTLTIQAEGVDLFGKVKSTKLSCLGNRTVKVYKQKGTEQSPSTDPVIASDISERQGDVGVWSVGNTGMEGKFYARTRATLECRGDSSPTIVARR
jgi:hypothetical protein